MCRRTFRKDAQALSEELRAAFEEHLEITRMQVGRLEEVFKSLSMAARGKACKGMKATVRLRLTTADWH